MSVHGCITSPCPVCAGTSASVLEYDRQAVARRRRPSWADEEPCGFLGCPNVIVKPFPWSMCDDCYEDVD